MNNVVYTHAFRFYDTPLRRAWITATKRTAMTISRIAQAFFWLALVGCGLFLISDQAESPLANITTVVLFASGLIRALYHIITRIEIDKDASGPINAEIYIPVITDLIIDREIKKLTQVYKHYDGRLAFGYDLIDVELSDVDRMTISADGYDAVNVKRLAMRLNTDVSVILSQIDGHKLSRYDIIERVNQVRRIIDAEADLNTIKHPTTLNMIHPAQSPFAKSLALKKEALHHTIKALDKDLEDIQNDLDQLSQKK